MSQSFAELGLTADVTRAIAEAGYAQPTPVQLQAIPPILQGQDVLAGAQNGTGKTAAFMLPLLQRLNDTPPETLAQHVRALIITPTRELAMQVEDCVRDYGCYLPLRSTALFGGVNMGPQIESLRDGAEIVVATPGRLLDHANEQTVDLSHVEMLVLDETDRMLDMGFLPDLQRIFAMLPPQRQNLLFAATISDGVVTLAEALLHNPVRVDAPVDAPKDAAVDVPVDAPAPAASGNSDSAQVAQRVLSTGQDRKRALLTHLIKKGDWKQVLVFTRSKHGANRLAHQLGRGGISATAIHGNKVQGGRIKALDDFKDGKVRVLVATDVAVRGLDIEDPAHVVNYDLPQAAADYVQRVGRTASAGKPGEAISLMAPEEQPLLTEIEKLIGRTLEISLIPGFEPGSVPPNRQPQRPAQPAGQPQSAQPPTDNARQGAVGGNDNPSNSGNGANPGNREGGGRNRRRRGRNRNGQNGDQQGSQPGPQQGAPRDPTAAMPGMHAGQTRMPNQQRAERNEPNGNRAKAQARREAWREDNDNRGNRDTSRRDKRNVILDDDFGNRIPPVKLNRGIRARIAAGDIDEELDNIGNRMPPPPKHLRHLDDEDEINYNVAPPPPQYPHEDDERQPMSNATQSFPSSAGFMGESRNGRGSGGNGNGGRRKRRRGGNGQVQGQQGQGQPRQGQPHLGQPRHQHRQGKKGGQGGNKGPGRHPPRQRGN